MSTIRVRIGALLAAGVLAAGLAGCAASGTAAGTTQSGSSTAPGYRHRDCVTPPRP